MPDSTPPPPDSDKDSLAFQKRLVLGAILVLIGGVGLLNFVVPDDGVGANDGESARASTADSPASARRAPKSPEARITPPELDPGVKRDRNRKVVHRSAPEPPPVEAVAEREQEAEEPEFDVYRPDADGIRDAVDERIGEIRHCYEQWLKWKPTIEGKVVVSFRIEVPGDDPERGPDGEPLAAITEVGLEEDEVGHLWMEGCVLGVFETLRFERPGDGPLIVNYPLRFEPE